MEIKKAIYFERSYNSRLGRYMLQDPSIIWVIKNPSEESMIISDFVEACTKSFTEYIPKKGDKLFFLPGCTVPRFKMKTFCETHKTAMVKYKESATALFVGPDSFKDTVKNTPTFVYHTHDLEKAVLKSSTDAAKCIKTLLEETDCEHVFMDYESKNMLSNLLGVPLNFEHLQDDDEVYDLCFQDHAAYENYLITTKGANIHSQDDILKKINTGAVMTEKQYISIQRLFESTDTQNHKVALEIMSNCDYEKSCVYLLLLIRKFYNKIYVCPTKNHVNFKSLLKFFGFQSLQNLDLDDIINSLLSRKLLSKSNLDILMPMAIEELSDKGGYNHFVVDKIKVSEDVEKGLEENILDGLRDTQIIPDLDEELNPTI